MVWTKWHITTIAYLVSPLFYIIAAIQYGSTEVHLDVGSLIFSIIPAYLILFWSLDEARKGTNEQIETLRKLTLEQISTLKESTEHQIESFATQCQGIVSSLEKVIGAIGQMSADVRKQMEQEERRLEALQKQNEDRLRTLEKEEQRHFEEKQRIAPRVFALLADEPWWFFFRHYKLYVNNTGGLLKNMELSYFFFNASYKTAEQIVRVDSLDRDKRSVPIDCGDVSAFSSYTAIKVSVSLRDKEERLYVGTATIDKSYRDWNKIPLIEKPGE
jgi:hypothetical protein